jgi:hypothetical protein
LGEAERTVTDGGAEAATADMIRSYLAPLEGSAEGPLAEHVERFGQVHAALHAALAEIDPAG